MDWKINSFEQLNLEELYALLALRTDVFVVEQSCPYPEVDRRDSACYHLLVKEKNELIAYLRILPRGQTFEEASIGRVLVSPSYRGQGLARFIMVKAIEFIEKEWKEEKIKIAAQAYLQDFYVQIGFEVVSDVYLEDDIPHVDMLYTKPTN